MVKLTKIIELIIEDVNHEDSFTLSLFSNILQNHFTLVILWGMPFLIYILFFAGRASLVKAELNFLLAFLAHGWPLSLLVNIPHHQTIHIILDSHYKYLISD